MYDESSILLDLTKNASQMSPSELDGYSALAYAIARYNFDEMLLKSGHLTVEKYKSSIRALGEDKVTQTLRSLIRESDNLELLYMDKDISPKRSFIYKREMFEKNILIGIYGNALKELQYLM